MNRFTTKGELENLISTGLTRWEKMYLGQGSLSTKADIIRNMVIVSMKSNMTPAEKQLSSTFENMLALKRHQTGLLEAGRTDINQIMKDLTGLEIISLHTDISTRTGERIIVIILSDDLEKKYFVKTHR